MTVPTIKFSKYHGCGNSFVIVTREVLRGLDKSDEQLSKNLTSLGFGVGADGLMIIEPSNNNVIPVSMHNPDGSLMGMCGNGIRCVYRFCADNNLIQTNPQQEFRVEERSIFCSSEDGGRTVEVAMGTASFEPDTIPVASSLPFISQPIEVEGLDYPVIGTCMSIGNPHLVCFVENSASQALALSHKVFNPSSILENWQQVGSLLEKHPLFPKRINVEFVEITGPETVKVVVWERGAGPTLACGTGACASAVVGICLGLLKNSVIKVDLPGGALKVSYDGQDSQVVMKGPAEHSIDGEFFLV